jgi:hypothetical protein
MMATKLPGETYRGNTLVQTAVNAIRTHLAEQGDLRTQAIEEKLITL